MEAVQNIPYEGRGTKTNAALGMCFKRIFKIFNLQKSLLIKSRKPTHLIRIYFNFRICRQSRPY